ncbi:triose-phosphate isomerase [Aspergillus novofumigatus IBT 16806]|uniref:Triosephosphate isomerase n=1 Tax=Aspergillus novofumigatus (strain IBT 16806) TaxID=1392255 RepID=A0A2I1CMP8_ASPN1|nr:Triosephosphate isomerase [Aspergillus novofumigatus IBT 16806]PKX98907.1 Triosephosphate isomerase [Aspergillus novofumigatus IBT 16806]
MATTKTTFPPLPKTLLIISLKMYFTPDRTLSYLRDLLAPPTKSLLLALVPDFLTIYPCAQIIKDWAAGFKLPSDFDPEPPFLLGAQDCFWEAAGAYTGEVSPASLHSLGVRLVELGHAERRALFGETDEQVARKAAAAVAHGLIPLVCIGEVTAPGAIASEAVGLAVRAVLGAIPSAAPVIFAYEPVWAIGKANPAGVDHVAAVVEGIRAVIGEREGQVRAVDGMFLGRFAHEIEGVKKVVQEVEQTLSEQ